MLSIKELDAVIRTLQTIREALRLSHVQMAVPRLEEGPQALPHGSQPPWLPEAEQKILNAMYEKGGQGCPPRDLRRKTGLDDRRFWMAGQSLQRRKLIHRPEWGLWSLTELGIQTVESMID